MATEVLLGNQKELQNKYKEYKDSGTQLNRCQMQQTYLYLYSSPSMDADGYTDGQWRFQPNFTWGGQGGASV